MNFVPDYQNIVDAACNKRPRRVPLYEHIISVPIMEKITGKKFHGLIETNPDEFFLHYNNFFKDMGYDTVMFEACITRILPGGGALGAHKEGVIKNMDDFLNYPWDLIEDLYFERHSKLFDALRRNMPDGMKAVGGVGNGVFECVQDIVGYTNLCYISIDDEKLYCLLFEKMGEVVRKIWKRFLNEYGNIYCVCRFGDDLGFNTSTLLSKEDIKKHIIPQYKKTISLIHSEGKPFLLHSCGCIFDVMDDLIKDAEIDAKHSNEDSIAPISRWIDEYGAKIGNFGGIDTDVLCNVNDTDVEEYVTRVFNTMNAKDGGFAIGSGNSIPEYVSFEKYVKAIETIRRLRGEEVV